MCRPSDINIAWPAAALLAAALLAGPAATAQAEPCGAAGASLATAAEQQAEGRPWASEAMLQQLAEAGCVEAMERLALLHWYGPQLHPGHPWKRELALRWFLRAADHGSAVARHMLEVAWHTPPRVPQRPA